MEPYIIRGGDYLFKLAHKFGFDADTVWNDDKNADLRELRGDHDILFPADVLYIPDQLDNAPDGKTLTVGSTNSFVASDAPTTTINVKFVAADGSPCAAMAYSVEELDQLTGLQTDADGAATFEVPVTLQSATLTFSDTGDSYHLQIGAMNPVDTLSGVFQRLQNLGLLDGDDEFDPDDLDRLRMALRYLKATQQSAGNDAAPDSAPESGPASSTDLPPASDSSPASSSSGAVAGDDYSPASDDDDGTSEDGSCVFADNMWFEDDSGLSDDGELADDVASLLVQAHGR